jgi:AcrR family transcriptional regulator
VGDHLNLDYRPILVGRRPSITREQLLAGAMAFVDEHGLEALTLRALAPTLGVSHTVVYTHFATKADMVNALTAEVLTDVLSADFLPETTPRDQLVAMAMAIRSGLLQHPNLVPAFLTAAGMSEFTGLVTGAVVTLLETAGLEPRDALVTYQALESFVFGYIIYEVGSDTDHLAVRRQRYGDVPHREAKKAARSDGSMRRLNDEAFLTGFQRLLDASGL